MFQSLTSTGSLINLGRIFFICDGHDGLGSIDPILDVLRGKKGRTGHRQRSQFHETEHYHVPLWNPR